MGAERMGLAGLLVLFVVFEFPTRGTAGYHSYNRALWQALLQQGARVQLLVLSARYKKLHDRLDDLAEGHGAQVDAPGLWRWRDHVLASSPRALLAAWRRRWPAAPVSAPGPRRVTIGRQVTPQECRRVARAAAALRPDLVLLDTLFCAPLAAQVGTCPSVVVAHDVFCDRVRSLLVAGLRASPWVDAASERAALLRCQAVIAISGGDASRLAGLLGGQRPVHCFAPLAELAPALSVPLSLLDPHDDTGKQAPPRLFYMGSGAHHNLQAMDWFMGEVWPLLRARQPELELLMAGDIGAGWAARRLPGLRVLGRVDDARQASSGCDLAIDPVQAGSGVKIKIVDYLAMGLGCVTTPAGALGLEAYHSLIQVADGPQAFCDSVLAGLRAGRDGAAREARVAALRALGGARHAARAQALAALLRPLARPLVRPLPHIAAGASVQP